MAARPRHDQRREAEALAAQLRKIPVQLQAKQRRLLTDALAQNPDLMLSSDLRPWLQFGDFVSAVDKLDKNQLHQAGSIVSEWLEAHDSRLNPDARDDVKARLDRFPRDLYRHLSIDAMALLDWPTFKDAMRGKEPSAWANHLQRRFEHGRPIDQADIPISVLRTRPDLAADIGPLAFGRVAAANLSDPVQRDQAAATLSRAWDELDRPDATAVDALTAALEGVSSDVLLTVELPAPLLVIGLWRDIVDRTEEIWSQLDHETRIVALYRAAAEKVPLQVSPLDEAHGLALAAELVFTARPGETDVDEGVHTAVSRVVIDHGWVDPDPPSLAPLLPACPVADSEVERVKYCEGKRWNGEVWCPRLRRTCNASHVTPEPTRPWWQWSLLELMDSRNVEWRRGHSGSGPNDIAGWLNRWHDIYERLRCSKCWTVMQPDYRYSQSLTAAYGKTVMDCPTGEPGHDKGIYLNHCNGCGEPIDSRECRQRIDGFYLCMWCGSGPETLDPGSTCSACGSANTAGSSINRWVTCLDCGHKVHVPPAR